MDVRCDISENYLPEEDGEGGGGGGGEEEDFKVAFESDAGDGPGLDYNHIPDEDLELLLEKVEQFTKLTGLAPSDWNDEVYTVVTYFLEHPQELVLTIYFNESQLAASLGFPSIPVLDMTYFMKGPLEITPENFCKIVKFGTLRGNVESTVLTLMESLFAPLIYCETQRPDTVKGELCSSLNVFLSYLMDFTYNVLGTTVLYIPREAIMLSVEEACNRKGLVKQLEGLVVQWTRQICVALGGVEQASSHKDKYVQDEFDFWVYRYKSLSGLKFQLQNEQLNHISSILQMAQSTYIEQFFNLTRHIQASLDEAKSNIEFLQLLNEACVEVEKVTNPAEIPAYLPGIIHLLHTIWMNSPYYNTNEKLCGLFKAVSNQIITQCKNSVMLLPILDGNSSLGIEQLEACICCLEKYRALYDTISEAHTEYTNEEWLLDDKVIFSHLESFKQRCHDMLEVCQCMIIFGRMNEKEKMPKAQFGGAFEGIRDKVESLFRDYLGSIKSAHKCILTVQDDSWHEHILKFRNQMKELELIIENMVTSAFDKVTTVQERIQMLKAISHYSKRTSLRPLFDQKIAHIVYYNSVLQSNFLSFQKLNTPKRGPVMVSCEIEGLKVSPTTTDHYNKMLPPPTTKTHYMCNLRAISKRATETLDASLSPTTHHEPIVKQSMGTQLVGIVVTMEKLQSDEQKDSVFPNVAPGRGTLTNFEDVFHRVLYETKGSIVDDPQLFTAAAITEQLSVAEGIGVAAAREGNHPCAKRAAIRQIDRMYQSSLDANTCGGLFEVHNLLHTCIEIMDAMGMFIREWLSDSTWERITKRDKLTFQPNPCELPADLPLIAWQEARCQCVRSFCLDRISFCVEDPTTSAKDHTNILIEHAQKRLISRSLLFCLRCFHAILLQCRNFHQLGWNVIYSLKNSVFEIVCYDSLQQSIFISVKKLQTGIRGLVMVSCELEGLKVSPTTTDHYNKMLPSPPTKMHYMCNLHDISKRAMETLDASLSPMTHNKPIVKQSMGTQLLGIVVTMENPQSDEHKDSVFPNVAAGHGALTDLEDVFHRVLYETKGSIIDDPQLFTAAAITEQLSVAEGIGVAAAREGNHPCAKGAPIRQIDRMYQSSLDANTCGGLFEGHNLLHTCIEIMDAMEWLKDSTWERITERDKLTFQPNPCPWKAGYTSELPADLPLIAAWQEAHCQCVRTFRPHRISFCVVDPTSRAKDHTDILIDHAQNRLISRSLLFCLRCFHAILLQCRNLHQLGWNVIYSLKNSVFEIVCYDSLQQSIFISVEKLQTGIRGLVMVSCELEGLKVSPTTTDHYNKMLPSPPTTKTHYMCNLRDISKRAMETLDASLSPMTHNEPIVKQSMGTQLLGIVVTMEKPQSDEHKDSVFSNVAAGHGTLTDLEDVFHRVLYETKVSIVDDPQLFTAAAITEQLSVAEGIGVVAAREGNPCAKDAPICLLHSINLSSSKGRLYQLVTDESSSVCQNISMYSSLLSCLRYFRAIFLECKKFEQLGWNVIYRINDSAFEVSKNLLRIYLNEHNETPWDAFKYLMSGVNYGGHVTDDCDCQLLLTYIKMYFNEDMETTNYRGSSLPIYYTPRDGSLETYLDYADILRNVNRPEAFGQYSYDQKSGDRSPNGVQLFF